MYFGDLGLNRNTLQKNFDDIISNWYCYKQDWNQKATLAWFLQFSFELMLRVNMKLSKPDISNVRVECTKFKI